MNEATTERASAARDAPDSEEAMRTEEAAPPVDAGAEAATVEAAVPEMDPFDWDAMAARGIDETLIDTLQLRNFILPITYDINFQLRVITC